ncbi:MAG: hypothetical protein H8D45_13680 [Bacteroidetes bacterium]|nr:hypothetical protein [Bacteroidota bacterium]MBL7103177.1 hypothetical protein [Bacteroidales bacterium]
MNAVINAEETCLLSAWQASFRWHELYPGSITEPGNLHDDDVKRNAQSIRRGRIPKHHAGAD